MITRVCKHSTAVGRRPKERADCQKWVAIFIFNYLLKKMLSSSRARSALDLLLLFMFAKVFFKCRVSSSTYFFHSLIQPIPMVPLCEPLVLPMETETDGLLRSGETELNFPARKNFH